MTPALNKSRLFGIIRKKSVILAREGQKIVTARGGNGSWLLDLRRTFMDAEGLELAAKLFWEKFSQKLPFQIGGLESGSVPLVAAIILESRRRGTPVNGFFVRKERKQIGRQHLIEGALTADPIVIVDDLLNSGGTLEKVLVALAEVDRKIREAFVIVNYENPAGAQFLQNHKIKLSWLFTLSDFGLARGKKAELAPNPDVFRIVWRFAPTELGYFHVVPKSTPALDHARIYFGTDAAIFFALDQRTGRPVWSFQAGRDRLGKGIFSSPAIYRNRVYFGGYDGNVYCLDTRTGCELWRFSEAEWVGSSPALAPELGLLFIGLEHGLKGQHGSVVALDLRTGEKIWEYFVRELLHGSPAYSPEKQLVAIGTNDATLLLLEAKTGRKLWEFAAGGPVKYRPAFDLARNAVLCGSHDGKFYSVDLTTGRERFSFQTGDIIYSTPLIVGDRTFVTSTDKKLYILDLKKQKLLDTFQTNGRIFASPRRIGASVYFGSNDGRVYSVASGKAKIVNYLQLPERITNAITYSPTHKLFYALTADNQLFAFTYGS